MRVDAIRPAFAARLAQIGRDASIAEIAALLAAGGRDLAVICDDHGLALGIVTRSDLMRHLSRGGAPSAAAGDLMVTAMVACGPDDDLLEVWQAMHGRQLSNMPVLDAGKSPIGVLRAGDALSALLAFERTQEASLVAYIAGVGYR